MEKIWFVYVDNKISGPLTTQEAEIQLDRAAEAGKGLVWWRGQTEWMPESKWQKDAALKSNSLPQNNYYLDTNNDAAVGPLSLDQLIERVRLVQDLDSVRIWSESSKRWHSPFEDSRLCEALGIQRRINTRAPLTGTAIIQKEGTQFLAPVVSVSIGGIGVRLESAPKISGTVNLTLKSPSLFNMIKAKAEVAYQNVNGEIGFKFSQLSVENKSAIIEYIRTFEEDSQAKRVA